MITWTGIVWFHDGMFTSRSLLYETNNMTLISILNHAVMAFYAHVGITMDNPGVFQANLYLYLSKPISMYKLGYRLSINPRVHPFTDRSYYRRLTKMNDIIHTTLLVLT